MDRDNLMIDYYSQRAAEYETVYAKPERQRDLQQLRSYLTKALAGHRVLELACGTGYWTHVIAQTAISILATDLSSEMLAIAQQKEYPSDRVTFKEMDAFNPVFSQGTFSAVYAGFLWSHIPRQALAIFLEKLQSCVGPGVRIMFIDNRFVPESSTAITRTDDEGNTYQLRKLSNGNTHEVLKNFPNSAELLLAIKKNGKDIEVNELSYYWTLSYMT